MTDSRVEKVRKRWFTGGWADAEGAPGYTAAAENAAIRMVTEMEQAELGVFDPEDEILIHRLAGWLQRHVCNVLTDDVAAIEAEELLQWLQEASKQ